MTWKDEYCLFALVIILFASNAKSQRSRQIGIRPGAIHIPSISSRHRNIISPNDLRNSNGDRNRFMGTDLQNELVRNRPFNGNHGLSRTITSVSDPVLGNTRRNENQQSRTTLDDVINSRISEQVSQPRRSRDRVRHRTSLNSGTAISRIRRKLLVDLRTTFRYIQRTGQLPRGVAFNMESGRPQLVQITPGSLAVNPFTSRQVRRYLRSIERSLNGQESSPTGQVNQADSTSRIGDSPVINTRQNNVESLRDITLGSAFTSSTNHRSVGHQTSSRQGLQPSRTASQNINPLTTRSRPNSQNTQIFSEPRTTQSQSQSILPGVPVQRLGDGQKWSNTLFRAKLFTEPDNTIQTTEIEIPRPFTRSRTERRPSERQVQQLNTRTRTENRQPERHVQQLNTRTRTEIRQPERHVQQLNTRTRTENRQPERQVQQLNTRTRTENRQPERQVQQLNTRTRTENRPPERQIRQMNTGLRTHAPTVVEQPVEHSTVDPDLKILHQKIEKEKALLTDLKRQEETLRNNINSLNNQQTSSSKLLEDIALLQNMLKQAESTSLANGANSEHSLNQPSSANIQPAEIHPHASLDQQLQQTGISQPPNVNQNLNVLPNVLNQNTAQNSKQEPPVVNAPVQHTASTLASLEALTGQPFFMNNAVPLQHTLPKNQPRQAPMGHSIMPINQPGQAPMGHSVMPINQRGQSPMSHSIMPINQPGQAPMGHSIMHTNQFGSSPFGLRLPSEFLQEMMFGDTTDPPDPTNPPTTTPIPTTLPPTTAHVLTTPLPKPPVRNQYHQQVNNAATLNDILSSLQNSAVKGGFKLLFQLPGSNSSIPIEVLNSKSKPLIKDSNPTVKLATSSPDKLLHKHLSGKEHSNPTVKLATSSPDKLLHKHLSGKEQTSTIRQNGYLPGIPMQAVPMLSHEVKNLKNDNNRKTMHNTHHKPNQLLTVQPITQLLPDVNPHPTLQQPRSSFNPQTSQSGNVHTTQNLSQLKIKQQENSVHQFDVNKTPVNSDTQVNRYNAIQMENFPSYYEYDLAKAKNVNNVKIPSGNSLILDIKGNQISRTTNTLNQHGVISQSQKPNSDLSKVVIKQNPATTTASYIINMIPYNTHAALPAIQPMTMNSNPNSNSNVNFKHTEINPVRIRPISKAHTEVNPLTDRLQRIEHMVNKLLTEQRTTPKPLPTTPFIEPDELEGEELPIITTPMTMTTQGRFDSNSQWQYKNPSHHNHHSHHNAHPNQQHLPNIEYRQPLTNQFNRNPSNQHNTAFSNQPHFTQPHVPSNDFGPHGTHQPFQNPRTNQNNAFSYQVHNQQGGHQSNQRYQDPSHRQNDVNSVKPPVFSKPHIQHQTNQHHQAPTNQPNNHHGHLRTNQNEHHGNEANKHNNIPVSHHASPNHETITSTVSHQQSPSSNIQNTSHQCHPKLPNFGCEGVGMFTSMKSIGAWCVSKCVQGQCVESVCQCGCYINSKTNIKINEIGNEIASAFSGNSGNSSNANKALVDLYASLNKDASSHGYAVSPVEKQTNTPITTTTAPSDVKSLLTSIEKLIESKLSHIGKSNNNHESSTRPNPNTKEHSFDPRKPIVTRSDTTNNIHKSQASQAVDWRSSHMSNNSPNNQWNHHLIHQLPHDARRSSHSPGWNQRQDVGFERRRVDSWHTQSNRNNDHNNWNNPSHHTNPQNWQHHHRQQSHHSTPPNNHWGNSGHRQNGPTSPRTWHDSRHSRRSGWQPTTTQGTWSFQGRRHWQSHPLPKQEGKRKGKKKGGEAEEQ